MPRAHHAWVAYIRLTPLTRSYEPEAPASAFFRRIRGTRTRWRFGLVLCVHHAIVRRSRSHSNGDGTTLVGERFKLADSIPPLALRPRPAAKALGVSERLLWQLTHDGHIPCVRVGSGRRKSVLYPVSTLEGWLARQAASGERGHA